MKKLSIFLIFLLFNVALFAQTYLDVAPGYGTLNTAITTNQGNVIYRLQAGAWYGLNGVIENSGFALKIVGTTPAAGQMPAEIQTATNADGTVLKYMFNMIGDVTLKNVFIVNADEHNSIGQGGVFSSASTTPIKLVLDSVTCDPVGFGHLVDFGSTPKPKLFITNSLFLRMGDMIGFNDGWFWSIDGGAPDNGFDTLYVENNTFMCTGTVMGGVNSFNTAVDNFIWINHNSFIFHKNSFLWDWHENSYFVTNNLFFDFSVLPFNKSWNVTFPDGDSAGSESLQALVNDDTTSSDTTVTNNVLNGNFLSYISYKDSTFSNSVWGFIKDTTIIYLGYDTTAPNGWSDNKTLISVSGNNTAGMKFTTDSTFVSLGVFCPTGGVIPNHMTFKLYKWNTDYVTTIAGTPIADSTFVNYVDETYLTLNFRRQTAGTYYWELSNGSGGPDIGAWLLNNDQNNATSTSYNNTTQLLSPRKLYVEYNSFYTDPRFQAYVTTWAASHTVNNDGKTPIPPSYLLHLMYPFDSLNVNREAGMVGSLSFPNFKEGHYLDNLEGTNPPNTDPQWTDPKFYATQDSLVLWVLPVDELTNWGFNPNNVNPQPNQLQNWFWNPDTNYGNPVTWPRVDCSYKNSTLLTGSIAGLPLGDLNWFPSSKAIWQKNKAAIMAHILSLDESPIKLTDVRLENSQTPSSFALSQNYPNPFNPSTEIKYSIAQTGMVTLKVYDVLGQVVATIVNQIQKPGNYTVNFNALKLASGVYMYRIQEGAFSVVKKMELLK